MNILTIGDSPYLISRNARINRDICTYLTSQGHKVDSLVFNHDTLYFVPGPRRESYYESSRLFTFGVDAGSECLMAYETMKKSQPQVVITIGHYATTDFIYNIKMLYPQLIKWIAIVTSGSDIINERNRDTLNYADTVIALNSKTHEALSNLLDVPIKLVKYGPGTEFYDEGLERSGVLYSAKNSQISNISVYLRATSGLTGSLHYNADDTGFYDVPLLSRRYNPKKTISMPEKFISVREGMADGLMNELYNRHSIVIDCSMQSITSISMLEAMRTGCIPIGADFGASGDILNQLPEQFRFILSSETYIGEKEETFSIVSHTNLRKTIKKVMKMSENKEWLQEARNTVKSLSVNFSKELFLSEVNQIVQDTMLCQNVIVVDSLV